MRNSALLVIAVLIAIFAVPPAISVASATPSGPSVAPSPSFFVTIGVDPGGATRFVPATIIIPQVNITLNITFMNNYTVGGGMRSEEHTSELQSRGHLVCRLLLEKKKEKT